MGKFDKGPYKDPPGTPRSKKSQTDLAKFLRKRNTLSPADLSKMAPASSLQLEGEEDSERDSIADSDHSEPLTASLIRSCMKKTLSQALKPVLKELSEIKAEILQVGQRVETLETAVSSITTFSEAVATVQEDHVTHLNRIYSMVEDQENRSRRRNVRIKGLPESWAQEALTKVTREVFAGLVGEERASSIIIERIHRAVRPKPRPSDPPRDVICGFLSYIDTAAILAAAREKRPILYDDVELTFYQDISPTTLMKRRILKPLLDALRAHNMNYAWLYPFGLAIMKDGRRVVIYTPSDLEKSWSVLGLEPIEVPSWLPIQAGQSLPPLPQFSPWQTVSSPKRTESKKTPLKMPVKNTPENT